MKRLIQNLLKILHNTRDRKKRRSESRTFKFDETAINQSKRFDALRVMTAEINNLAIVIRTSQNILTIIARYVDFLKLVEQMRSVKASFIRTLMKKHIIHDDVAFVMRQKDNLMQ